MEHSNIKTDPIIDFEHHEKLQDYELIEPEKLKAGSHFRYSKNKYKEEGRSCNYAIVKKVLEDGTLVVNGYKSKFQDWKIKPSCRYKQYLFYKKKELEYTGECLKCGNDVDEPYFICYTCKFPEQE
jgi:hypothetical protein